MMNFLDMRTIVFTMLITNCICTFIVALLWYRNRIRFTGLFYNVLDFVFQTTGIFLIGLRGSIPDWISMVVANTILVTGTLLGYIGLEYFTNKKSRQIHNYVLIGIFVVIHAYFTCVHDDLTMRNLNLCAAWLIIGLQCFWLLVYRVDRAMKPVTIGVGMVYGVLSFLNLVRIVHELMHVGLVRDWYHSGAFEAIVLLCYKLLLILLTYALVLMVNKRLLLEVRQQEEKFSRAFHSSPYGILLTRVQDGTIFEVNEGFERLSGYRASEILGKTTTELHVWERHMLLNGLSDKGVIQGIELTLTRKTGEIRTVIVTSDILTINDEKALLSTVNDITGRKQAEMEREKLIHELENAMGNVKALSGLLPICSSCKRIRNDKGYWEHIEQYISEHSEADFSHGICPECANRLYPEVFNKK